MILGASAGLTLPAGAKAQEGWRSRWPVLRFGVITTETGDALSTTYRGFDEYLARALGGEQNEIEAVGNLVDAIFDCDARHRLKSSRSGGAGKRVRLAATGPKRNYNATLPVGV